MLNIKDIRNKFLENPEPPEVYEIRTKIKTAFKNLEFIEDGHIYTLYKEDGSSKNMNSVSSICHLFEPVVNWDEILIRKSEKMGIATEELKRQWRETNITSTSNGTLTHLFAEGYMYFIMGMVENIPEVIYKMQYEDGYLIPYGGKQKAIAKYYEDMFQTNGLYPVMPETQIYIDSEDNPYGINKDISGTFDALFCYKDRNGQWKLSIRDWKTNKSLTNDFNRAKDNKLLAPFDNLINEPLNIYNLQLCLYQLGLQQLGFEIGDRKILWLLDNGEYEKIDVPDISKTLITALQ